MRARAGTIGGQGPAQGGGNPTAAMGRFGRRADGRFSSGQGLKLATDGREKLRLVPGKARATGTVTLQPDRLSGPQKAAIVVTQMPPELAKAVTAKLSEAEVARLSRTVASLPVLDPATVKQVMSEYIARVKALSSTRQGGLDVARRLLHERFGAQRADQELERLLQSSEPRPFTFLHGADPKEIAEFLAGEHPQLIAVVVANLPPGLAAQVLAALDDQVRPQVALRVASMAQVPRASVMAVASALSERFVDHYLGPATEAAATGAVTLAMILNRSERQVERQVLAAIDERDQDLAENVRRQLFTFDDVLSLDDKTMQKVLRYVQPKTLATALKGADEPTVQPFLRNISENAAKDLLEEIEALGPVRRSEVEGAQVDIARTVRELEAEGTITIIRKGDEVVL